MLKSFRKVLKIFFDARSCTNYPQNSIYQRVNETYLIFEMSKTEEIC